MFSYFDIAIIVVVVIGALIGLWRGFFKTLISFFGWFVSFLIAFFLTKPVVGALLEVGKIKNFVVGTEGWSLYSWIYGGLPNLTEGGVLSTLLQPLVRVAEAVAGGSVEQKVALLLANGMFSIMVCIGLLIVLRLLLILFTMFANAMTANRFVGALNRLLGLALGAVKGFAFVCVVLVFMSFLMGLGFMEPVRNDLDKSLVAKPVYGAVVKMTDKFISGGAERLEKLVHITGLDREQPEEPENPENPENPDAPETPDTPENPGGGETPTTPENPGGGETPTNPEGGESGTTTPPENGGETEQTSLASRIRIYVPAAA